MKNKIRIDRNWVHCNSHGYRLTYAGELSDYQKKRIGIVCKKEVILSVIRDMRGVVSGFSFTE